MESTAAKTSTKTRFLGNYPLPRSIVAFRDWANLSREFFRVSANKIKNTNLFFCLLTSYLEFRPETMALEVWNSGSQDFE